MKILIVDDDPVNRLLFKKMAEQLVGVQATCFENPSAALAWSKLEIPDLVLLDYMMPNMDGISFLGNFRAIKGLRGVPVFMITASHAIDLQCHALEASATDFLYKPVQGPIFLARVRNLLNLRRSQLELADRAKQLTHEVDEAVKRIVEEELEMVVRISRMAEFRDLETCAHLNRMAEYSRHIADSLGFSPDEQRIILAAAPMHDIGKIGIPDGILLKQGKLDAREFDIMKRHTVIGYEMLKNSRSTLLQAGAEIAISHHEYFDGRGYPRGLAGEQIPLYGRIVAVADVFDALTSSRSYKPAWSVEQALAFMQDRKGGQFDPEIYEAFLKRWDHVLDIKAQFQDKVP